MNKILYIDDDRKLGEVAKSILETFGYQVIIVDNNDELETILWDEFRLIIIDWMFPGGAMAVCEQARLKGFSKKVMVVSSRDIGNTQRLSLDQQGITFLSKPFSAISLPDAVEKSFK